MTFLNSNDFRPASIPRESLQGQLFQRAIGHVQTACMHYTNGRLGESLVALKLALEVFETMSLVEYLSAETVAEAAADLEFAGAWKFVDALQYFVRRKTDDAYHACRIG